jgi:hypothetical protein
MTTAEQFLCEIEAFLDRTHMSATAFGKLSVGDPSFVHDLRGGRSPSLGLVDRVRQFMSEHDQQKPSQRASA